MSRETSSFRQKERRSSFLPLFDGTGPVGKTVSSPDSFHSRVRWLWSTDRSRVVFDSSYWCSPSHRSVGARYLLRWEGTSQLRPFRPRFCAEVVFSSTLWYSCRPFPWRPRERFALCLLSRTRTGWTVPVGGR